jgi:hypothetical protein
MEDTETPCEHTYGEITNHSNYDGNCTLRRSRRGTYKITGRLVFVSRSVQDGLQYIDLCLCNIFSDRDFEFVGLSSWRVFRSVRLEIFMLGLPMGKR